LHRRIETALKALRSTRSLCGQDLPSDFVMPDYSGRSLANVPATVLRHFGISDVSTPALAPELVGKELQGARKLVILLVDALGFQDLSRQMEEDKQLFGFPQMAERGRFTPITSVFPSTTAAAVSTFHTGVAPAEHGITGYRMYMQEYGFIANMIRLSPESDERLGRLLTKKGDERRLLGVPTVHSRLNSAGVKSFCLIQDTICNSGLSRMIFDGASEVVPFVNSSDLLVRIRELVNSDPEVPACIWAYWGAVDSVQHQYGTWGPAPEAEVGNFGYSLQRELLAPLFQKPPKTKTAMMLLADHGQVQTNVQDVVDLRKSRKLMRSLLVPPTGTGRSPYFYLRDGEREQARTSMARIIGEKGLVLDSKACLEAGLWGNNKENSKIMNRVGDLVILMKGSHSIFYPFKVDSKPEHLAGGRHGGLHEKEMLVPFFCLKLR